MSSITKQRIRRAFDKSSADYARYASFQNEVADEVAVAIERMKIAGGVALDIGCGAGRLTARLAESGVFSAIVALDLSGGMAKQTRLACKEFTSVYTIQADAERLPVKENSIDLAVSSLAMQWMDDLPGVFQMIATALKPGGRLIGATLGSGTFSELREAFKYATGGRLKSGSNGTFHKFVTEEKVSRMMTEAGMEVKITSGHRVKTYDSLPHFLKTLKKTGAQNSDGLSHLGLGRRSVMEKLTSAYHEKFAVNGGGGSGGGVRATYDLIMFDAVRV
ncbi:hypothetical protein MNBD_NITROSPINAE03-1574 [hydrothermal vent metagenome]|uniref:malonyl-[acyl-carrier protein] O-methyltransferase n=1 Tax=hydrothermal vent metagenome TaxID=652676 RepID=A0A3B1C221_9ZZZZ